MAIRQAGLIYHLAGPDGKAVCGTQCPYGTYVHFGRKWRPSFVVPKERFEKEWSILRCGRCEAKARKPK